MGVLFFSQYGGFVCIFHWQRAENSGKLKSQQTQTTTFLHPHDIHCRQIGSQSTYPYLMFSWWQRKPFQLPSMHLQGTFGFLVHLCVEYMPFLEQYLVRYSGFLSLFRLHLTLFRNKFSLKLSCDWIWSLQCHLQRYNWTSDDLRLSCAIHCGNLGLLCYCECPAIFWLGWICIRLSRKTKKLEYQKYLLTLDLGWSNKLSCKISALYLENRKSCGHLKF